MMKPMVLDKLAVAVALSLAAPAVFAQAFPNKPLRLVLPFAAGGISDVMGRMVAAEMSKNLGQPVVAENRPGAGSALGADAVAKSAPDGHTICFCGNAALTIVPNLNKETPYNPLKDLKPVGSTYAVDTFLLVRANHPATSLAQLVAAAKAKPDSISYGSNGPGSSAHLTGSLLESMAGIKLIHVPYKGEAPQTTDVLGGQLDVAIVSSAGAVAQSKAGKVRVLATASGARSRFLPDVPTIAESGYPGYESPLWNVLVVPAATPMASMEALRGSIGTAMKTPGIEDRMIAAGVSPVVAQPTIAAMDQAIVREHERWAGLITKLGLKAQ